MSTVLAIVRREYLTRVRRRAFVVATVLGPILTVGLIAGLVLLTQSTEDPVKVWVVDHDGLITVPTDGGQFVPTCPACYRERPLLTYRFGTEEKTKEELQAEGYTCMVTFDAGLMQSEKMQLLKLSPPPGRAKRAMERDFSEALERLKVRSGGFGLRRLPVAQDGRVPSWRSTSRPGNKRARNAPCWASCSASSCSRSCSSTACMSCAASLKRSPTASWRWC